MHRRHFLKTAAASSLALPIIRTTPRNQRYRVALIGSGWWGMNILRTALATSEVDVAGMCDVDRNQLSPAVEEIEHLTGSRPTAYADYRELLNAERPDIVIVATPDHWHALCAIAAIESGAHVYLEKPISHTIGEGFAIFAAARTNERVVQVGTHRRVSPHNMAAMAFLRAGHVGDVGMVRAFVHYGGNAGQTTPDSDPPDGLDWDRWCGPAPLIPYNERIHPRGFRRYLDFANGQLGDWGIHWLDQILWWTEERFPHTIYSTGGQHIKRDGTDAPDTQVATFAFESFTATWEHRLYAANEAEKTNIGCYFYGTKGTLHLGWLDGWTFYPSDNREPVQHEDPQLDEPDQQNIRALWQDFVQAIETGQAPACDIDHGLRATNMCLLGMISLKTGRSVRWDSVRNDIIDDAEASALLRRPYRAPWTYPEA